MRFYVYILLSLVNGDLYIGSAQDIDSRLERHNAGKVKSTKAYRPWKLLETHEYGSRSKAVLGEKFYKQHQQKEILRKKYNLN
ncbi:TPA: endonuclease [Patescibacteria group bacterium]|nr:MAG: Excinuclease ABC C subunit domain protein [Parcubacteria group bacterium GW2011_GWA2_46_39]HBV33599.1 endonuclease [Patescibacteria group bacterium]HCU48183.1 endonuclease [Patescibacteria group bacterium]